MMKYKLFLILITIVSLLLSTPNTEARQLDEIDKLIKKYGKGLIQDVILDNQGSVTIQVGNELRDAFGLQQWKYITKYSISHDLRRMGMSVKKLEYLVEKHIVHLKRYKLAYEEDKPKLSVDRPRERSKSIISGTGWVCRLGYVVTSYHVIANRKNIFLLFSNGSQIKAKIKITDKANDISILVPQKVGKLPHAIQISSKSVGLGSKVFTIGFPHIDVMGIAPKITSGEVSSTKGIMDDPNMIQISIPIQSGNSGGPILNMKGEVVAVVRSKLSALAMLKYKGDLPQIVNYGVKAKHINKLLEKLSLNESVKILTPAKAPLEILAERIQHSVMIVFGQ